MAIITFTKPNGETGTKKVNPMFMDREIAALTAYGHTVHAAPTATPAPAAEVTGQTGTVGKAHTVHAIIEGHTRCGASYRRNSLGATTRRVKVTGETITCHNCK